MRALSFDLDGTLVDTAGEIAEVANRTLVDFGVAAWPPEQVKAFIGHGARPLMLKLLAHTLLRQPELADRLPADAVLARMDEHHAALAGQRSQPYPGCEAALQRLRAAGLKLACVTNKEGRFAERVLEASGLARHFDLLVAGDTLPQRKPDPAVLQHVAAALGSPPHRMAHVGDSPIDIQCARAAGMPAWGVSWGYAGDTPIEAAGPQRVFHDFDALVRAVLAPAPLAIDLGAPPASSTNRGATAWP